MRCKGGHALKGGTSLEREGECKKTKCNKRKDMKNWGGEEKPRAQRKRKGVRSGSQRRKKKEP